MNLRDIQRTAASITIALTCLWMPSVAAQQEIKLTKSITVLPDHPSGIRMITKFFNNQHGAQDRFVLTFLTTAEYAANRGYYEDVLGFAAGKPVEFSNWETADCSEFQTMVFRIPSPRGPKLFVGTAARTGFINGQWISSQADPSPQRIRFYVPKRSEPKGFDTSPVWLDSVTETVTSKSLCTVDEVRQSIQTLLNQHMTELGSQ